MEHSAARGLESGSTSGLPSRSVDDADGNGI